MTDATEGPPDDGGPAAPTGSGWFSPLRIGIALVLVAAALIAWQSTRGSSPVYRTATVGTGTVEATLDAVGTITPANQASLNFNVSGTVSAVDVSVGQTVTAGQTLASLNIADLNATVVSAQATLAAAQATLASAEASQTDTEVVSSTSSDTPTSSSSAPTTSNHHHGAVIGFGPVRIGEDHPAPGHAGCRSDATGCRFVPSRLDAGPGDHRVRRPGITRHPRRSDDDIDDHHHRSEPCWRRSPTHLCPGLEPGVRGPGQGRRRHQDGQSGRECADLGARGVLRIGVRIVLGGVTVEHRQDGSELGQYRVHTVGRIGVHCLQPR